ncbi:hypothetical protein [Microbacterium sp. Root553]|uniref:hypothetical protein n=1 Tax=Microbacterium sp. Root553 TaxID=1736556 RepID=UPI000701D728|nr:hypothetical protein [Microbacterium sp. Root553]KQZ25240.1 hypothetical protein ASD43_13450 [Microbacterium sp. Root553]
MRAQNDTLQTAPAVSWIAVRIALVAVVAVGAFVLNPLVGWQWVAVILAVTAAVLPQTFAAWGGAACIVIGMLLSEPDVGRATLAVLVVHAIHILTSLTLVIPGGTRVVLAALRPTAIRFVLVQAIAQPLTIAVMLGVDGIRGTAPWAIVAGGVAVAAAAVLLLRSAGPSTGRSATADRRGG